MNTATQPPPVTEAADRFRCAADIPDPPPDAAGRKLYWEDTVAEAVAELRRRLASNYDEKSFEALQMILDLEKTRIRHKEPVAGTKVAGRFDHGLGSLEDSMYTGGKYQGPKKEDLTPPAPATPPGWVAPAGSDSASTDSRRESATLPEPTPPAWEVLHTPKPARPIPLRERVKLQDGIHGHFHDHDDDYLLERRGRRKREPEPGAADDPDRIDWAVVWDTFLKTLPTPPTIRREGNLCVISLREKAPDGEPPATAQTAEFECDPPLFGRDCGLSRPMV